VHEREQVISVRVRPRSSRASVAVGSDGGLVVRVHAPAAEGAANRECLALLAQALGVAKSRVRIIRGQKSRSKHIVVDGLSVAQARARLERRAGGDGQAR